MKYVTLLAASMITALLLAISLTGCIRPDRLAIFNVGADTSDPGLFARNGQKLHPSVLSAFDLSCHPPPRLPRAALPHRPARRHRRPRVSSSRALFSWVLRQLSAKVIWALTSTLSIKP